MVWDLPIRIFHWLLVLSICGSFITIQNDWMLAHEKCGLTILGLLAFRLIWVSLATQSRFAQFVKGARNIFTYTNLSDAKKFIHLDTIRWALSVIVLLSVIRYGAIGAYLDDIIYDGPLYNVFPMFTKFAEVCINFCHP